jgi:hypothetical protein
MPGQDGPGPVAGPGLTEDLLEVCLVNANGKLTRPVWGRSLQEGLNGPQVLLIQQLRDEVEKAYPTPPANPAAGEGTKQ